MLPIGGVNEAAASIIFTLFFLKALGKASIFITKKNITLYREWMIRAFAIGLAISTVRPITVLFFFFSRLSPKIFFGTAFWIGFTMHLMAAETWINCTREIGQPVLRM